MTICGSNFRSWNSGNFPEFFQFSDYMRINRENLPFCAIRCGKFPGFFPIFRTICGSIGKIFRWLSADLSMVLLVNPLHISNGRTVKDFLEITTLTISSAPHSRCHLIFFFFFFFQIPRRTFIRSISDPALRQTSYLENLPFLGAFLPPWLGLGPIRDNSSAHSSDPALRKFLRRSPPPPHSRRFRVVCFFRFFPPLIATGRDCCRPKIRFFFPRNSAVPAPAASFVWLEPSVPRCCRISPKIVDLCWF